ncbi:homing endonuclease associated repeat-containing protein [Natronoarchaeum philippinense]|nr:HNH endonuclease [Natronoarchaeum philippinense]
MVNPVSEEKILLDLYGLYRMLGDVPTESQYASLGRYSVGSVRRKFGTFTTGRERAGVPTADKRGGQNRIPRADLLEALQELDDTLEGSPTREQMDAQGRYSGGPYEREFGGWSAALKAADIEPNQHSNYIEFECEFCGSEDRKLVSKIADSGRIFCSQECLNEWRSEEFSGSAHPLWDRVRVECEICTKELLRRPSIVEPKQRVFCSYSCFSEWCSEERVGEDHPQWKGGGELYYGPNFQRQREKRLKADNYQCQNCGRAQDDHRDAYGRSLEIHHRTPVREFYQDIDTEAGETPNWEAMNALSNLVTLCIECHRDVE